jgi:hypothetical protein
MASLGLLLAIALGTEPGATGAKFSDRTAIVRGDSNSPQRPLHEIQNQLSELLKREAVAKDAAARAAAIRALCQLHGEILHDERYATSDKLKEYRARLWSRLTKIKGELKQQLAKGGKANKEALEAVAALESADPAAVAAADSLASSLSLLDQTQGGPGNLLAFGGGAVPNGGQDLVNLIERTINPSFWDVAGGPGSIVYYYPLQVLVVRATAEVHGQIGGVIGDLRAAGP